MQINQRNRAISLVGLTWILLASCTLSLADEGDARLRKRIAELEAENRALRKLITGIQTVLKSVPESARLDAKKASDLQIVVFPGEWGSSELADIKKVCESAGRAITVQLTDDEGFAPILVQKDKSGPITLYQRGQGNEHIVRLNTSDRAWAQLAFQFSHEFCHIVCNYRNVSNPQLWFEEMLCECASLYSLGRMAIEWETNPPYSNWKSYAAALANYADDRVKKYDGRTEAITLFYQDNLQELEKTATNRELNGYIAVKLLPLLDETPTAWQALRYLNLGPAEENVSLKTYLTGWHNRVPPRHRIFIRKIAREFDLELSPASQSD